MKNFKTSEFTIKSYQSFVEYITRKEKLGRFKPAKGFYVFVDGQKYNFHFKERMSLTGLKYTFINHKTRNIVTFW